MKKTILLFSLLVLAIGAKAQGNLQFNQVKLVSTVETVPAGKVWKVENPIFAGGQVFVIVTYSGGSMAYYINGQICYIASSNGSSITTNNSPNTLGFPFWLPAGSTLAASTNMRYLSVIEFNVVP